MFPSIHRPLKFGIPFREEGEASLPLGTTVGILYHIVATLNSDFETMLLWQDLFLFLSSGHANFDMLHFLHNPIVFFFFCFHLKTSFFRGSVGFIGLLGVHASEVDVHQVLPLRDFALGRSSLT